MTQEMFQIHSLEEGKVMKSIDTIIPPSLNKGDTIGIVSPSDPIIPETRSQLDKGIQFLEKHGFKIELAANTLKNTLGYSATAQEKADDINKMFAAQHIKAIICSQGGHNANAVLPLLDYGQIKSNPKIFSGMSDITVLLNAIHEQTGLITFHSNDLMWGFGWNCTLYEEQEFLDRLVDKKIGIINKNNKWQCIRKGIAEGKLIGGNLRCLAKLAGTKYFPAMDGAILFLEYYGEESPETLVSAYFNQLEQLGVFRKINGLWLGYYKSPQNIPIEKIANEVTAKYDFPIMQCDDFGHNTPNTVIPVGCLAQLDATNRNLELTVSYMA
jgi:muramoyltetrapeptide carboxypeptidase